MGLGRKQLATKEDLRCVEDKMAAKNQVETLAISVEESGRDMVQHLLEYWATMCRGRGFTSTADAGHIYYNASAISSRRGEG